MKYFDHFIRRKKHNSFDYLNKDKHLSKMKAHKNGFLNIQC